MRRTFVAAVSWCLVFCSAAASAQEVTDAVVEGLPQRIRHAEATSRGDLLLALGPEAEAPMMQVIALRSAFQRELIKFAQARWGERGVDHVAEGSDRSVWAISAREVLTRETATAPWRRIELDQLEERACQEWEQYGTHCQEIIPLGGGRGIVLRPAYVAGADGEVVLGTQVVVVASDKDRELGSISLPGLLLGPSVSDAKGGFWVMIRRPQKLSNNYKPLRGYLHFTAEGAWEMWNNSKEQLDDVEYKGVAAFEINPEPRKMAPDGAGGFFAVGRNRQIYHIDEAGQSVEFGPPQLRCQYCQQLALSWDAQSRELHVLSAQWRDSGGRRQLYEGLRWWRLDSRGQVIAQTAVPGADKGDDLFFDQVSVRSNNGAAWILGPNLWLHHDGRAWTRLISGQASRTVGANGQVSASGSDTKPAGEPVSPQVATAIMGGAALLSSAGVLGSMFIAPEQETTIALYAWMFGALAAYYPASVTLPYTSGADTSWACLGAGFTTMTALTGLGVWGSAELFVASTYEGTGSEYKLDPTRMPGAFGGAALGTLAAFGVSSLVYGGQPDPEKDALVGGLGAILASSIATFGYYLFIEDPIDNDGIVNRRGERIKPKPEIPVINASFGFTW